MRTKGPSVEGALAQWCKLLDWVPLELFRGTVFRCLEASWPYERVVDFMLIELPESPSGLAVMVATGYKAGLVLVHLPAEARSGEGARALSTKWVVENWVKWIYPTCTLDSVQVIGNYPAGVRIEDTPHSPSRNLEIGS